MINVSRAASKVRQIEKPRGASQDIVARIKATGIYKFYAGHLKPHPFVHGLVNWIWRNVYTIYVIYVIYIATPLGNRHAKHRRYLIKLSEFASKNGVPVCKLADAARVSTRAPRVFPDRDRGCLAPLHDHYEFPEVFVAIMGNAITCGGTNLVFADGEVVCHDLYDFERDTTSEELHGRAIIEPRSRQIWWYSNDEAPERIPVAATFVDACAPNYAHWMTEVLPRLALFCADERFKGVPIVVDDGLHKNIMESLLVVTGADREIITLPIGRAIQIDTLFLTSVAGYVPFARRNKKNSGHSHGVFSPRAFELILKIIFCSEGKLPEQAWPEKIYLRRNSGARKVTNAATLEKLLLARGYTIVEPENLTFFQQVQLFRHVKIIIGSSGAALTNILFAPPNVKVLVLISKHPDTSYWYWQNIACASGKRVSYVVGEAAGKYSGIHANFTVDLGDVIQALDEES